MKLNFNIKMEFIKEQNITILTHRTFYTKKELRNHNLITFDIIGKLLNCGS